MIKEIGSEFWQTTQQENDRHLFLSGRTALEYIVRDIKSKKNCQKVLLPSYCCHTMIEPFVRHGFSIRFYDVYYSDKKKCLCADVPPCQQNEVLFYTSYFGFAQISGLDIETLRAEYRIVIDDRTHSWLRLQNFKAQPDYSFTSFRKWGAYSGIAEACKYDGKFCIEAGHECNQQYTSMRDIAFRMKADYMECGGDKSAFLRMFEEAEMLLEKDYEGYRPSYCAVDELLNTNWNAIRNRRRENAEILLEELTGIKEVALPFKQLDDADAPLFVPIILKDKRDMLRKYLIEHNVYCPVHWPKSALHESISERASLLYSTELSLLCDQRYGREEMLRIGSLISEYYR